MCEHSCFWFFIELLKTYQRDHLCDILTIYFWFFIQVINGSEFFNMILVPLSKHSNF